VKAKSAKTPVIKPVTKVFRFWYDVGAERWLTAKMLDDVSVDMDSELLAWTIRLKSTGTITYEFPVEELSSEIHDEFLASIRAYIEFHPVYSEAYYQATLESLRKLKLRLEESFTKGD